MAEHSSIEWTDATYNPITGCSIVSPGCTNCYAMRLAGTRLAHHPSRAGLTRDTKAGPVWTGEVRLNEQWLDQPLRWRRPRRIFVCAHGDLFAEGVPDEWIDRVFAVMAAAHWHTFQVLTKRAERMKAYMARPQLGREVEIFDTPLPNVWLGVSAEDQRRAEERIPHLLATPAAVRFVSAEPLLGPIDLNDIPYEPGCRGSSLVPQEITGLVGNCIGVVPALDWIIVGGESGPHVRPMHPEWARSLRDQCAAAEVAFFMKQMAKKASIPNNLFVREFPETRALTREIAGGGQ